MTEIQRSANKTSLGSLLLRMEQCRVTGEKSKYLQPSRRSSTGSSLSSLSIEQESGRPDLPRHPRTSFSQRKESLSRMSRTSLSHSSLSLERKSSRLGSTMSLPHSSLSSLSLEEEDEQPKLPPGMAGRLTKVVTHTKKCSACHQALSDDGVFALGKLFHKSCFRCKNCKKKLGQRFFTLQGSPSCANCYKAGKEVCAECGDKISDDHISCSNKLYHPHCMKCQVCGEVVRGKYLVYKESPICEKDFREVGHVCDVCNEVIMDNMYTIEGVVMCEKDYQELVSSWPCAACGKAIPPDGHDALMVGDVRFHHACLECEVCHKNMEGKVVTLDKENKVYCTEDFNRLFGIKCSTCKKPIVPKKGQTKAPRIRALGKDFHLACFKCEDCGLVLDSGVKGKECWPIRSHTLCYRCFRRRQSESEIDSD